MKQNFSLLFVGGILRAAKLNLETELKIQIYTGGTLQVPVLQKNWKKEWKEIFL